MTRTPAITRRRFLQQAGIGGLTLLGWPPRLSWAVEPHAASGSLRVVYYTDIHARVEWDTPQAMLMAAAAINAQRPDVVLCGGDLITDGYTSSPEVVAPRWDAYLAMHRAITPTPFAALGNHDLVGIEPEDGSAPVENPRADFLARLEVSRTYRSFDHEGYHFIILDSLEPTSDEFKYRGWVNEEQMNWLHADLQAMDPDTPIVLMTHMPLATSFFQMVDGHGKGVPPNRGVMNNRDVLAALKDRKLLAVLQGHLHVNEMIRLNGITFITGGAVCGKWWRGSWHGTGEGFGMLELHPDRVDWSYHTYGWTARRPDGV